ncbi:MAG: rhodanese-like domain-containing protein [Desulfobacteraceae bacterium]|nr:MAG: rhodanese-like domain-containing protein [Desulfobacteraceae bacterium]
MMRKIVYEAMLVMLIALVLAGASYIVRPDALTLVGSAPPAVPIEDNGQLFKQISFEQAQKMFAEKNALFADARPLVAYEAGHIQGAVHLDPNLFDQWADRLMASYPSDRPIVAYCEGPRCALSKELAEKLTWLGFEQVFYMVDGWGQWVTHEMPVD